MGINSSFFFESELNIFNINSYKKLSIKDLKNSISKKATIGERSSIPMRGSIFRIVESIGSVILKIKALKGPAYVFTGLNQDKITLIRMDMINSSENISMNWAINNRISVLI